MVSFGYVDDPYLYLVAQAIPLMPRQGANTFGGLRLSVGHAILLPKSCVENGSRTTTGHARARSSVGGGAGMVKR